MKRVLAAAIVTMAAASLQAQEPSAREFGSASGGEVRMIVKTPATTSGSLGLQLMGDDARRYEGTFGGALVKDRVWFFASAQRSESKWLASSDPAWDSDAVAGRVDAVAAERLTLSAASFSPGRSFGALPVNDAPRTPSSFLSLRATSNVTSSTFFTATVWRGPASGVELAPNTGSPNR